MNATVAKIVDILFQNTEMTQEAQALHDEVMTNCQDRYDDLSAHGQTPDEAIACVIESLKGMEDVINACPKKQPVAEQAQTTRSGEQLVRVDTAGLLNISYDVVNASLRCRPAAGDAVTVRWDDQTCQGLEAYREGDTLYVKAQTASGAGWLTKFFAFVGDRSDVTIEIPNGTALNLRTHSMSGDMDVQDIALRDADINTTSGDISLCALSGSKLGRLIANTASGDVSIRANADSAAVKSMSGDVEAACDCNNLNVSSVSGDVDVRSFCEDAVIKSVSGDVDFEASNPALKRAQISSTSGDVSLRVCCESLNLRTSTVSGSIRNLVPNADNANATTQISLSSVSGDLSVTR